MKLQVEEALKEAGKSFPFSFECPAAELGDVDEFPWKDATVAIDGTYGFDGNHIVVHGNIGESAATPAADACHRYWWIGMKHCLKSMVRKQGFQRTYCPTMGNTSI